jgi:hypothetical protein
MNLIETLKPLVEGTLDIRRADYAPNAGTPRYNLLFLRYDQSFKGGHSTPTQWWVPLLSKPILLELGSKLMTPRIELSNSKRRAQFPFLT